MGFLQICAGVILLQLSKSAKDVPDTAVFTGDLDQVRTVAEQEQPESEPKADAIRGTAAIIRRISQSRQQLEAAEAKRVHEERLKDQMEPIGEDEHVEWDGLRRRKTSRAQPGSLRRSKTLHPPLGMTHFPDETENDERRSNYGERTDNGSFLGSFRRRAQSIIQRKPPGTAGSEYPNTATMTGTSYKEDGTITTSEPMEMSHVYGLPPGLQSDGVDGPGGSGWASTGQHGQPLAWADSVGQERGKSRGSLAPEPPPHTAKRQFSFHNVFHRPKNESVDSTHSHRPTSRLGLGSRHSSKDLTLPGMKSKNATEEERLGLVKGDSTAMLPLPDYASDDDGDWQIEGRTETKTNTAASRPRASSAAIPIHEEQELEEYEDRRGNWGPYGSTPTSPELRTVLPAPVAATGVRSRGWRGEDESDREREERTVKEWEAGGRGAGGGGGGGGGGVGPRHGSGRSGGGGGAFI